MAMDQNSTDPLDAMVKIGSAEELDNPAFRKLYDLWEEKRAHRNMPSREDFNPNEFPELLPFVAMADIENEPTRMRLRLIGTAVTEMLGYEATGQYMDVMPDMGARLARAYWIIENKQPILVNDMPLTNPRKGFTTHSTLILPLSEDENRVNILMSIFSFS